MLYLTFTIISRVDRAHYGVSRAKGWVSVDCCTILDKVKIATFDWLGRKHR